MFYPPKKFPKLRKTLEKYAADCLSDKIISCKKHKQAAARFLSDLDRSDKNLSEWVFDEAAAAEYFEFMTFFKHSDGLLAGQQKLPVGYELFVYGNIYGWKHRKDGSRRFRISYEQLARKNAKSQDKAIQALYEISFFGEGRCEAYIAATKKEQTRHVWGQAKWLLENVTPELSELFSCKFEQEYMSTVIKFKPTGAIFSRLSKDDKKSGDGSNPQFQILDEYHLHESTEYYDLAASGMKTRQNPLLSIITTAGFDLSRPCYSVEYEYVSKILDPDNPVENDRYFVMICEVDRNDTDDILTTPDGREIEPGGYLDKLDSDEAILKSNPVIGYSKPMMSNIRNGVLEAFDKPHKMRDVLTKSLNIWVNMRQTGYMDLAKWGKCAYKNDQNGVFLVDFIKKNTDKKCYVGLDLSAKLDLTSAAFEFRDPKNGVYYAMSHSFMPQETYLSRMAVDKVPYDLWERQGWLTLTPGPVVDYRYVLKFVQDFIKRNGLHLAEVCVDPWGATQISGDLTDQGLTVVEVVQGYRTLSEPTKDLREMAYAGRLVHDGSPVLTWAMGNAVTRQDHNKNITLDKLKAKQRIDPAAALMNAHVRCMKNTPVRRNAVAFI
jgi:phage terminase large subunit-like protein